MRSRSRNDESVRPVPTSEQSRTPSPLRAVIGTCAVLVLIGVTSVSIYGHRREAALDYIRSSSGEFHTIVPTWWPDAVPFPAWLGEIDVAAVYGSPCDLRRLKPLGELRSLVCAGCEMDRAGFQQVGSFRRLTLLNLDRTTISDDDLMSLRDCQRLTQLNVAWTAVTDQGLESLATLRIVELNLSGTTVSDAGLAHLAGMPLRALHLNDTAVSDEGFPHLGQLRLKTLAVERTDITGAGLRHFAGLPLEELSLAGASVTDAGLADLASLASLRDLDLADTQITDKGLEHLTTLPITSLSLAQTAVTDAGLQTLKRLPLKTLTLSGARLSREALATLREMKTLHSLTLSGPPFTEDDVDVLRHLGVTVAFETREGE
ncbi:MAG TPA: hypothetical protein VHB77_08220 [Planctomycetaceae bacterium]|nr:hypothetical protein [Planctomycetaceae bacterium]